MVLLRRVRELLGRREAARRLGRGAPDPPPATPSAPGPPDPPAVLPAPDLRELEAQAHFHRDRVALYRARVLTAKPASAARLRELERASAAADARLRDAARAGAITPREP
jgi:hypothetical protein